MPKCIMNAAGIQAAAIQPDNAASGAPSSMMRVVVAVGAHNGKPTHLAMTGNPGRLRPAAAKSPKAY